MQGRPGQAEMVSRRSRADVTAVAMAMAIAMAAALLVAVTLFARPAWAGSWDKVQPSADLRLRYEGNFDAPNREAGDYHRGRLRARLGLKFEMNDWLDFGIRGRTGNPDDPNSPHEDFKNNFNTFNFGLDRAFAHVHAGAVEIWGGKFGHATKYQEVLWDGDVQPTGVAAAFTHKADGPLSKIKPVAFYYLVHNPNGDAVTSASGAQAQIGLKFGDISIGLAPGVLMFKETAALLGESNPAASSNRVEVGGDGEPTGFVSDFTIVDTPIDIGLQVGGLALKLSADVFVNTGADDENLGWWAGFDLGKLKDAGDWRIRYHMMDVGQDATMAAFAQDDFRLTTNFQGHDAQFNYVLAPGFTANFKAYLFKSKVDDNPDTDDAEDQLQTRARLDFEVKF